MEPVPQRRRIRASARVPETPDVCRASELLMAILAALGAVVGIFYFIAMLFPALAA